MRYLTLGEVLDLYQKVITQSGGRPGVRDIAILESCLAQPRMTFEASDLYPSLTDKAAALCYSLIASHPFIDGNKRLGHAAAETFLLLNGLELSATVDEQESMIMKIASSQATRNDLAVWLQSNTVPTKGMK